MTRTKTTEITRRAVYMIFAVVYEYLKKDPNRWLKNTVLGLVKPFVSDGSGESEEVRSRMSDKTFSAICYLKRNKHNRKRQFPKGSHIPGLRQALCFQQGPRATY